MPTISAVGVASPIAHGQAMISTATAAVNAVAAPAPASSQPASVTSAIAITIGTKIGGDTVGEPLHRCLPCLRLLDETCDLGERGVGADLARTNDESAGGVDRRAGELAAGADLDRDGLAGEHRLVDGRVALDHDAVGGDLLARPNDE